MTVDPSEKHPPTEIETKSHTADTVLQDPWACYEDRDAPCTGEDPWQVDSPDDQEECCCCCC